jgi:hypothetical protein
MLSPHCSRLKSKFNKSNVKVKKLIASHLPQKNYLVSLNLLQVIVKLGLVVDKIHSIISFIQLPIFKSYIEENIRLRQEAQTDFYKNLLKLSNNVIFGRTIMNDTKYAQKCNVLNTSVKMENALRSPYLKRLITVNENLTIGVIGKEKIKIMSPLMTGLLILERAKAQMYDFYYNILFKWSDKRNLNVRLAYTDTDSLMFSADVPDWKVELSRPDCLLKHYIDFSNLPPDHPLFNDDHKGQLGYLKEEVKFEPIIDFIALQPKTYVLLTKSQKEKKSAKGVKYCKHKELMHKQYRRVLKREREISITSHNIRAVNLSRLVTKKESKVALSLYENKRYWFDAKKSVAYGHWSII